MISSYCHATTTFFILYKTITLPPTPINLSLLRTPNVSPENPSYSLLVGHDHDYRGGRR
ncbi:hypothetical protein CR513_09182, partial [Mucuna pruriens]